jgi:hypothetical protein
MSFPVLGQVKAVTAMGTFCTYFKKKGTQKHTVLLSKQRGKGKARGQQ